MANFGLFLLLGTEFVAQFIIFVLHLYNFCNIVTSIRAAPSVVDITVVPVLGGGDSSGALFKYVDFINVSGRPVHFIKECCFSCLGNDFYRIFFQCCLWQLNRTYASNLFCSVQI